jgi:lipopolysaccharide export system permease protein
MSYLGPFVMTFFIALFILLMQFLWKYLDDLVGKGLEWYVVAQLLIFASASLVPLALPLAILLSSIMTFGNMGEHYELVACKAAGISLQRIMFPLVITSILISIGAFFFSNSIMPYANLKMGSLLYDVRQQKPAFSIKEGIFYSGIEGYSIKVSKKDPDGQTLRNIMIYDHTAAVGNNRIILADKGRMLMSHDDRYLLVNLYNGKNYEEKENRKGNYDTHPLLRTIFKEETVRFDLTAFKLTRTNEDLFKDNYQMLNVKQLSVARDTLKKKLNERKKEFANTMNTFFYFKRDSLSSKMHASSRFTGNSEFIHLFDKITRQAIIQMALNNTRNSQTLIRSTAEDLHEREKLIFRHEIEWNRKFTLSFACFVLFFIGAPLGAIIRKGGLGLPVVFSTIFFVSFHVMSITGEKFAREGILNAATGMWMASIILLPVGVFLTYKATTDSALFEGDAYRRWFKKRMEKWPKRRPKLAK